MSRIEALTKSLASFHKDSPTAALSVDLAVSGLIGPDNIAKADRGGLPEPYQDEGQHLLDVVCADYARRDGITRAQAWAKLDTDYPELYRWHQSLAKREPDEARPVAAQRPGPRYAHEPLAAEIEKRVRETVKPFASTLPQHEYEAKYLAAYDHFVSKTPQGQALYRLHEQVFGRTIAELDQDAPAMSARVRKFM